MKKRKYNLIRKTLCTDYCLVEATSKEEALRLVYDSMDWHHDLFKVYPWKVTLKKKEGSPKEGR
jgi:hypothetical protein